MSEQYWSGKIENICPMTLPRADGPHQCCEKQCAWWITYYKDDPKEYSECAIKSIGCLADIGG